MNIPTFILDTSFLLALLNPKDLLHKKAIDQVFSIEADIIRFEIPLVCAVESIIKAEHPEKITAYLTELIDQKDFEVTIKDDLDFITNLPSKTRCKLKANDCSILAICKRLNAKLLTLDKKLSEVSQLLISPRNLL